MWRLCFIADSEALPQKDIIQVMEKAVRGGATLVQLRGKKWSDREFFSLALEAREILRPKKIPLIINDRIDIALAAEAQGVHLGQKDLPLKVARKLAGERLIIGISVNTVKEAKEAESEGANYLGAGPVFWTGSKEDLRPTLGLEGLKAICQAVSLPVLAIGGITAASIPEIMASGAAGVAVISAIARADDPEQAARSLREAIDLSIR
jgi:thiamine-phosphate pyrophosphorylase